MTLSVVGERVIVEIERRKDQHESKTPSGLILIENYAPNRAGWVVACKESAPVKPDDVVIFSPESGQTLEVGDRNYLILDEDEILAVYEPEGAPV